MARRVVVITYFFPPVGGVGVQRTLKFVTYLPRWGWDAVVVTPRDPGYLLRDPSLVAEVPAGLDVRRSLSLEPTRLVRAIRGRAEPRLSPDAGVAAMSGGGLARRERIGPVARFLAAGARLWNRAWGAILFPDEAVAWLPFALRAAVVAARSTTVDAVYSSSPPVTTHLVAGLTKRLTGRPWVADFRDEWVGNPFAPPASGARRRLERRTERWIVDHADAVVLATETIREAMASRYPDRVGRFTWIPNGYDRAELRDLPTVPDAPDGRFRLVYVGSLYRERELGALLTGVERLLDRRPDMRARLRIEFVGWLNVASRAVAQAFAARLGDVIAFVGQVPRREALARMVQADALLQIVDHPAAIGGKLMEYIATGRPILAVVPSGEARRLVDGLPGGRTADVAPEAIARALEQLVDDPPTSSDSDPAGRYDRVNLSAELAAVLDRVVADAQGRSQ
jgi:glycosyltransferase involved in cell wall biosynthesis